MDGRTDGRTDGRAGGRADGRTDGRTLTTDTLTGLMYELSGRHMPMSEAVTCRNRVLLLVGVATDGVDEA